jgi:hypothetical protein
VLQGLRYTTEYCGGLSARRRVFPMSAPLALLANASIGGMPLSEAVIRKKLIPRKPRKAA